MCDKEKKKTEKQQEQESRRLAYLYVAFLQGMDEQAASCEARLGLK